MGEIEFIFQMNDFDAEALQPQVSKALQRRMELRNQQLRPGKADLAQMTEQQRKQAKTKSIIQGVIWIAAGIYFLISGFTKENASMFLPVIGLIAIAVGIRQLLPQRKKNTNTERFDKAAKEFLTGHKENIDGQERQICFSDEEVIIVTGAVEDLDQEAVTYDEVEFAMETEDIILLVHGGHGILLQKKDITLGSVEDFRSHMQAHVKSFTPYETAAAEAVEQPEQVEQSEHTEEAEAE